MTEIRDFNGFLGNGFVYFCVCPKADCSLFTTDKNWAEEFYKQYADLGAMVTFHTFKVEIPDFVDTGSQFCLS